MSQPFLLIQDLRKLFGEVAAVDGVSLQVKKGEFLSFLGPSGSGKSTTLYAVAGLDNPTSGDVMLDGRSILGTPPHRRTSRAGWRRCWPSCASRATDHACPRSSQGVSSSASPWGGPSPMIHRCC